jgi:hypothetical protein
MSRRIVWVGAERNAYPRETWGARDREAERLEMDAIGKPLTHAPGGPPPELKFRLFPERIVGGVRSKAIDALIEKHVGRRVSRQ